MRRRFARQIVASQVLPPRFVHIKMSPEDQKIGIACIIIHELMEGVSGRDHRQTQNY